MDNKAMYKSREMILDLKKQRAYLELKYTEIDRQIKDIQNNCPHIEYFTLVDDYNICYMCDRSISLHQLKSIESKEISSHGIRIK